jgi:hypothetical protein
MLESIMPVDEILSSLENEAPPVTEWADLTEQHLEDWLDAQLDSLKTFTPMTDTWEKDMAKIWTRLDIKQIGKDNIMPTVLAYAKLAKTHRMEDLLDTSKKYQKIRMDSFINSITPQAAARHVEMETEKSTLAGQAHRKWNEWLREICIPAISGWLALHPPDEFYALIREEALREDQTTSLGHKRRVDDIKSKDEGPIVKKLRKQLNVANAKLSKAMEMPRDGKPFDKRRGVCFNCGGEHLLADCPTPHNLKKIENARAIYLKNKQAAYHRKLAGPGDTITTEAPALPPHIPYGGSWSSLPTGELIYRAPEI